MPVNFQYFCVLLLLKCISNQVFFLKIKVDPQKLVLKSCFSELLAQKLSLLILLGSIINSSILQRIERVHVPSNPATYVVLQSQNSDMLQTSHDSETTVMVQVTSVWHKMRACSSYTEQVLNDDGKTWCGGQDSNLRTNKEWDLNPPPLTKLGDPRAGLGR